MGSSTILPVLIATPVHAARQRQRLWAAAAVSTLLGAALLPMALHALDVLHQLPHWQALEHTLALLPRVAWLVMLLCLLGMATSAMATVFAAAPRYGVGSLLASTLAALVWFVHLPDAALCDLQSAGCYTLLKLTPLALGAALSALVFAASVRLLAHWHLVSMPDSQPDVLDHYRYGK